MKKDLTVSQDILRSNFFKGLAIIAVLIIHYLSAMPWGTFTSNPLHERYIALDQLSRFCVPLFLALSGYGLTKKYFKGINLIEFYTRRLVHLLPSYILWSILLWLVFMQVPLWYGSPPFKDLWRVLLHGSADYHLYFVPLILQFYIIFPLLLLILKRSKLLLLVLGFAIQLYCLHLFKKWTGRSDLSFVFNDQTQYATLFPWLAYFILGMYLATTEFFNKRVLKILLVVAVVASVYVMIQDASNHIAGGLDPLYALKFTRYVIVLYASTFILFALSGIKKIIPLPLVFEKAIAVIGQNSFLIYLSHTLLFRLYFTERYIGVTTQQTIIGSCALIVGVITSYLLEKRLAR